METREATILTVSPERFRQGPARPRLKRRLGQNVAAAVISLRQDNEPQPAGMFIDGKHRFEQRRKIAHTAPEHNSRIADVFYVSEDKNYGSFTAGEVTTKVDIAASAIILFLDIHGYRDEARWLNDYCRMEAEVGEGIDSIHETAIEYIYNLDQELFAKLQQSRVTPTHDE